MHSSMTCKGSCWDNAPTKSPWGSLTVGRLLRHAAPSQGQVIDWLTFYIHRRLHSTLGYVSPMRFDLGEVLHGFGQWAGG